MSTVEILALLALRDVRLWVEQGRLRYRAPEGELDEELRTLLVQHEEALRAHLGEQHVPSMEFPLSHAQRALWGRHRVAPGGAADTVCFSARVRSRLDVVAFRRALRALLERHPSLRTVFRERPEGPMQLVADEFTVSFEEVEASGWSEEALEARAVELFQRPVDLERGPLLRAHLLRRGEADSLLLLLVHSIAVDLESLWGVLDELGALYAAETTGGRAELPAPGSRYVDFIWRQEEWLWSEDGERHWAFWKKELEEELPVVELPTDGPRPSERSCLGDVHSFSLEPSLTRGLEELARRAGTTPHTVLLTAFQAWLSRASGQESFHVGTLTSGRAWPELAHTVGCFAQPVALRADLSGAPSFLELLERSERTTQAALAHQAYPFAVLVERLRPAGEPGRAPFFQTMFVLESSHRSPEVLPFVLGVGGARMRLGGLELESFPLRRVMTRFDLELRMVEEGDTLRGHLLYPADLFAPTTARRMMEQFRLLLEGLVAAPHTPVARLPLPEDAGRVADAEGWSGERTARWRSIWSNLYRMGERQAADPSFDVVGWYSSYTIQPLPEEEMREWVETTVQDVLALRPRRVLEIGCGSGLVLFRVAPVCERYVAVDFSPAALEVLGRRLEGRGLSQVTLMQGSADELAFEPESFDVVIINSVVQYFPGADYLRRVLRRSVERVRPGGTVFVGDVRSLPLLESFHASVLVHHAAPSVTRALLRQQVSERMAREVELLLAPAFFLELRAELPRLSRVDVLPRRGRYTNELTRFRYQALLHVGETPALPSVTWTEWDASWTLEAVRRHLMAGGPEVWGLAGVANARLEDEVRLLRWLASEGEGPATVGEWWAEAGTRRCPGLEPAALWELGEALGLAVGLSWARHEAEGRFDVVFSQKGGEPVVASPEADAAGRRGELANDPRRGRRLPGTGGA
jgi:ubiquinone/menaquinone biosynthesis C-methylase UbiE